MKQAFSAGVSSPPFPRTSPHWVRILMSMALCGWQCLPLAAQEADTTQAVRSTFSISSAYFVNDYANNMDYVQFDLDLITASSRLSLYGYQSALIYQFFFRGKAIGIMCQAGGPESEKIKIDDAFKRVQPLCQQVLNSVVLPQAY